MKKHTKNEIKEYAEKNIENRVNSASQGSPNDGLWFRKLEPDGHYVAGDKYSVYNVKSFQKRIYLDKVIG